MKKFQFVFITAALITIAVQPFAQQPEVLNNEKVIKLFKAGFSKEILKSKILNSPGEFDVSIDGMLELKKAGVSEEIINTMISKPVPTPEPTSISVVKEMNRPGFNLPTGIYYQDKNGEYQEIEPSVLTGSKANAAAQVLLGSLFNAKTKSTLSGKQSSFTIYDNSPKFLFVFDSLNKGNLSTDNNSWMTNARSPKEFLLVKLSVQRNSREIIVGKGNAVSASSGIDDKNVVHFTSKKLANGVYEVVPDSDFSTGEYCFMFAQGIRQGESSKVFDFSKRERRGF